MTDAARHSIVFGGEEFAFLIERTTRRKTVAISVGFDGVRVLAPSDLDDDSVLGIVRRKGPWLLRKQAMYRELGGQPIAKEFVSGETFHYLGCQYRLKLIPDETAVMTRIIAKGSNLVAPVLPNTHKSIQRAAVRSGLKQWYRTHAAQHFPARARMIANTLGIPTPTLKVVDQSKRWGSCDARGCIRLNWRLVMAPMPLIDYVVAHEACHILEHNHSRRFWRSLETIMPDFEDRLRRLDRMGHHFTW
ncbi:M48 family metallopeptidase [Rhodovulum sulfidophilum]|uniref:M48 family metallopeptidase n=1 Tax=Rhodovulum sulfidophilum TaxID=35806 RepID=A0ABS1RWW8_RHOSU|nr:SprT family zinc-dependent metalloprotease [Rhodovulum sulfidophilum]MBL3609997.1 M48 family metallopeptidase [Rhodovulum sulfidophilum]MCE8454994.1 M48 family metallopeptidase [Rhodovulum sulfidophilum]